MPAGLKMEVGSEQAFLCDRPRVLAPPVRMRGWPKVWGLPTERSSSRGRPALQRHSCARESMQAQGLIMRARAYRASARSCRQGCSPSRGRIISSQQISSRG